MTEPDASPVRRGLRRRQPAGPRAVAAWCRIGLVLGTPALLAWSAALVLLGVWLGTRERDVAVSAGAALVCGLLLAWLSRVFLLRVWSEPLGANLPRADRGRRALSAFDAFLGAGLLISLLRYVGVPRLASGSLALACYTAAVACFAVALRAAFRDRRRT